jgi:hypothetical protein
LIEAIRAQAIPRSTHHGLLDIEAVTVGGLGVGGIMRHEFNGNVYQDTTDSANCGVLPGPDDHAMKLGDVDGDGLADALLPLPRAAGQPAQFRVFVTQGSFHELCIQDAGVILGDSVSVGASRSHGVSRLETSEQDGRCLRGYEFDGLKYALHDRSCDSIFP